MHLISNQLALHLNLFVIEFTREIKREILVVVRYIQYMGVLAASIKLEVVFICHCDGGV
jgi:hypothetical protein